MLGLFPKLNNMCNLLIASTSTVYGQKYLEYLEEEIISFYKNCRNVVFVPYARPGGISWDEYTNIAAKAFNRLGIELKGIHRFESAGEAVKNADGFFAGGGNTFLLLKTIYEMGIMDTWKTRLNEGIPYMGTSAGSNILGQTIQNTNDMPIVYPPSFNALGMVPFNINPHYMDPNPNLKHMGESRETRIKEYLVHNEVPVVGLREGSYLLVEGKRVRLQGPLTARIFTKERAPYEIEAGEYLNF